MTRPDLEGRGAVRLGVAADQNSTTPRDRARYLALDLALTAFPSGQKYPQQAGWHRDPIRSEAELADRARRGDTNLGVIHGLSGTAALDVDQEAWTRQALAAVGVNLDDLLADLRIRGARGAKPFYRVPDGRELGYKVLRWPHPTERTANGRPKPVTVFELRAGPGRQDVLPPSIHPNGMQYAWEPGPPRSRRDIPEPPAALLALWECWHDYLPAMLAACPWAPKAEKPAPRRTARSEPAGDSVIARFNAEHDLPDLLARYGYERKAGGRYLPPESESGLAGAVLLTGADHKERLYVHNASSVLCDGQSHDAFDVFAAHEHNGDVRSAVGAAASALGMDRQDNAGAPAPPTRRLRKRARLREWFS